MDSRAVRNIDEVNRALLLAGADFHKEKSRRLKSFGRPVANDAQRLAQERITNIGRHWDDMRVGVTPDMVYVAPVQRGTKVAARQRKSFAGRLMGLAMIPALELNRESIANKIDALCERMVRRFNRG